MRRILVGTFSVLILASAGFFGCGGEDSAGGNSDRFALGTLCDTEFPDNCPNGLCIPGIVIGTSETDYSSATYNSSSAMCTKTCEGSGDCGGIDFATANGVNLKSDVWSCTSTTDGKVCAVEVTAPGSTHSGPCDGCGGAFCAGSCIGCPDC
jgi:hypothetical protein